MRSCVGRLVVSNDAETTGAASCVSRVWCSLLTALLATPKRVGWHQLVLVSCAPLSKPLLDLTGVAVTCAGQGEDDDETDEGQDRQDKYAAFGACGSAAQQGLAEWVRGEEMVLNH
jgi:hypothetical protein